MPEGDDELAAQVQRLLEAVQDWAARFPRPDRGTHPAAAECLPWCPICQFANLLRGEHPEVVERLTDAADAIAAATKALADAVLSAPQREPSARRPRPAPRVEHIRLDEPPES